MKHLNYLLHIFDYQKPTIENFDLYHIEQIFISHSLIFIKIILNFIMNYGIY